MNWNKFKLRIMPIVLLAICCLFGFIDSIQAQHVLVQSAQQQPFVQPNIEYGAWNPVVDHVDYLPETKINRARSIPSSPHERQFVPKSQIKNRNRGDAVKSQNRRNFEAAAPQDQNIEKKPNVSTLRPAYKRRTYSTSTTISTPPATIKFESSTGSQFKNHLKNTSDVVTAKPRRPFTLRTTSENVLVTASEFPSSTRASPGKKIIVTTSEAPSSTRASPVKKVPPSRGNFRPKSSSKEAGDTKDDGDNYPEHFKQLLKSKEVFTEGNDKNVIKKPIKPFRPTSTSEKPIRPVTSANKPKSNVLFPTRQNRFLPKAQSITATTTEAPSSSSQSVTVVPKRPLRTRTRPTERTRANIGSTLQEPPTIKKSTPIYATRSPVAQESEAYEDRIITQADGLKQIDPPISEYIPRTNAIGSSSSALKFSSRFRNSENLSKNGREPSYQATVPTITSTSQLDLNDIDLDRWREILPLAAELIQNDAEIMTQSPSQTVSIYEALAEILSKPTESLSFLNNKSTESTLISEAPFSSTTTPTTSTTSTTTTSTTTTSTTTQQPTTSTAAFESSKDNSSLILDLLQKYQNETDTQVKSQNIFSLAKKTHSHELDHNSQSEHEENKINYILPETVFTTVTPLQFEEKLTTQSTIAAGKVSVHPNGIDSSTNPTSSTVELPKSTRDSFENEIFFDENEESGFRTSPSPKTTVQVTRTTSSISSSSTSIPKTSQSSTTLFFDDTSPITFPTTTTENIADRNLKVLQELLNTRKTTKEIPQTTEVPQTTNINFVDRNVKALQELLGNTRKTTMEIYETTEVPQTVPTTTANFVEENQKILQQLLGNTRKAVQQTTDIQTTTSKNFVDENVKILQQLLGNTRKTSQKNLRTTEMPTSTTKNFVDSNFDILQQLLGNTRKSNQILTTTDIPKTTTKNFVDTNVNILQQLLGNTRKTTQQTYSTTEVPSTFFISTTESPKTFVSTTELPITTKTRTTQPSTTITRRKVPTQLSTQSTRNTEAISSTTSIKQTVQTTDQSSTQSVSDAITTSTSIVPKTTHRFTPLQIPNDPPSTKFIETTTTQQPTRKAPFTDQDDLDFLRQLSKFINGGATTATIRRLTTTTRRPTTQSTTTTTQSTTSTTQSTTISTTPSTTTSTTPIPTTSTTQSTTTRPLTTIPKLTSSRLPTTHSDADDISFLMNLRDYAGIINLTTERSALAQKILELALNRTSKSVVDSKQSANNLLESMKPAPFTTTQSPELIMSKIANAQKDINMMSAIIEGNSNGRVQTKLSPEEIEKTKKMLQKDVNQYNKDIQLLSLLIGRPLNDRDIAKLAATNLGKPNVKVPAFTPLPASTTTTLGTTSTTQSSSSTNSIPAFKHLSDSESQFLQALQQIQTTRSQSTTSTSTTTTSTSSPRPITSIPRNLQSRPRSQEALIADLLKQQGIGPANINQIPIDKLIEQLSNDNRLNRGILLTPVPTTTIRPFSPMPPLNRQPRPILDGLSWLWRTWQETAPGYQTAPVRQQSFAPFSSFAQPVRPQQPQPQQTASNIDDLSFDDQQDSSSNGGFVGNSPLGQNGFLGAAIGVTRAVSRFLGVALTGAGQVLQGAFSGGSSASNPNFGLFGGSRL
ncbi:unnamed protein product [Chironomus riparius]|uniref:Mucin-5AC n=1 Tax=Chironomus riparius TaxID=315576 RepID=A0A9P0NNP2_9DIPT|nr:unnamed protein product [Chironomus riparius]